MPTQLESKDWSENHQTLFVGNLKLHVARRSLFAVPTDSIVNSENTRFRLAPTAQNSVSSQLAERYGSQLQVDLHEKTKGKEQPPGTVIETSGYGDFDRIYHAGHQPIQVFSSASLSDEERANHLRIIRQSIAEILHRFGESSSTSIAFPLLGCGFFDLDPWLFGYEFMHELLEQSSEPSLLDKEVWLTVYENDHYPTVLNGLTQALSDQAKQRGGWNPMHLGVGYIDRFEQTVCGSTHPRWMAWLLVRYAELVTGHLLCLLASTRSLSPPDLFDPDRPACFGVLRTHAYRLAKELRQIPPSSLEEWACRIAESTYNQAGRLSRLNEDRNNIAHGRDCRSHHDIRRDVEAVIDSLREIVQDSKRLPRPEGLTPWTCVQAENQIGVLDRWRKDKKWRYLLPDQRRLIEVDVPQSSRSS